jgi:excisionase family DNA binding protein
MNLTVPEAARRVHRNPETIRRWIRSGRLRSTKVGTQHLVSAEDLDAVAAPETLELPPSWRNADRGQMPPWEQLVRDGRSSH